MTMRCVVTGRKNGKSVVVADTQVEPITVSLLPGTEFHQLWGSDTPPILPTDGQEPERKGYFPPPGGYRFGFFTLGPDSVTMPEDLDIESALLELGTRLPGLADAMEPEHPGMHTTDTVDLDLVVSGEVWLELDDGEEVRLGVGDSVVQNGTRHAWHNRTSEPAVLFVTLLGAARTPR
ncbi:MAG TPA: cupin domain-containing protein [Acidimicrobiales bacterium]|jgi:mannose-6-phosphate isomerase-like protein (cupin superfamily)